MKIHHLNCGTMCPRGGGLLPDLIPSRMPCRCLLVETAHHLVLIDTGLGLEDVRNPARLGASSGLIGFVLDEKETAHARLRALGYSPEDVTDVIVTHLDLDHAGGISDFPWARIHVHRQELETARNRPKWIHRQRYRPSQLPESARWQTFDRGGGETWLGFQTTKEMNGLPSEFLLVDLPGHSVGHTGIAIHDGSQVLLHAGDAYYDHRSLLPGVPWPLGLKLFERIVHEDIALAQETSSSLSKALRQAPELRIVCSHDANESPLL